MLTVDYSNLKTKKIKSTIILNNTSANNRNLAKNTMILYVQMIFVIVINLYSVRLLLKVLGAEDYGTYNVVGGVVTMFSFIAGSMTSGAQRFFAFDIGKNDYKQLSNTFNTTNMIYWILALITLLLLETVGLWFVNTKMVFGEGRMHAVNWIYQFSILTFIVNIISIPYNALIIAHEKMSIYSLINILNNVFKLIAVLLLLIISSDKLIAYCFFVFLFSVLIRIFFQIYCVRHFKECKFYFCWNKKLINALLSYSGFNMIGAGAVLLRNQGINIILNIFFGPVINAARGIAMQISGVINSFVTNLYFSSRPQITKYYAADDTDKMWKLVIESTKVSYYILMIISIPFCIEIDYVLSLWLGEYPDYLPIFIILTLVMFLVEATSNQLVAVLQAANKIKRLQLTSVIILLTNVPIAYLLLKIGFNPVAPFISTIFISVLYVISIIFITSKESGQNMSVYIKQVAILLFVTGLSCILPYLVHIALPYSFLRFVCVCFTTIVFTFLIIWYIGMNRYERNKIKEVMIAKLYKR